MANLKIGVIGLGHLGNFHVQQLSQLENVQVAAVFDNNPARLNEIAEKYSVPKATSVSALIDTCDALSIVTPTSMHHEIALQTIESGRHVFIEKPITNTFEQATELLEAAAKAGVFIQVGHIEEFNPAYLSIKNVQKDARFIEAHRLSPFNPRGTDVPVVLDLMIHDIGIALSLIDEELVDVKANGVKILSASVDIANARLEFRNGAVANLTASRISQKQMRKMRIFKEQEYTSLDFVSGSVNRFRIRGSQSVEQLADGEIAIPLQGIEDKVLLHRQQQVEKTNALRSELAHFCDAILSDTNPSVDGEKGRRALEVAIKIQSVIDES